jgi:tripartite-type tricarboxylate transporter receptor subunit TctC
MKPLNLSRRVAAIGVISALALATVGSAHAQTAGPFPSKVVTLVVPFTSSSGSDIIARIIAPKLSAKWGQPVIVDNKPGASGNLGARAVATATPDGHTLLMAINTFTSAPAVYKTMPFDAVADFTQIGKLAEAGFALAVNPAVPAKDLASLISYIKKNGGKLNYATPGNGTPQHLSMELLKLDQHLEVMHVPYKGIQGALTDLMGGQVQMAISSVPSVRPFAEAGKLRLLAVTGQARNPLVPDVPTFKEQGISVMDGVDAWYAVMGPARMAPALVKRLNQDFIDVMNNEEVKSALLKQGLFVRTSTPAEMNVLVKNDMARWLKVVREAHIEAD